MAPTPVSSTSNATAKQGLAFWRNMTTGGVALALDFPGRIGFRIFHQG